MWHCHMVGSMHKGAPISQKGLGCLGHCYAQERLLRLQHLGRSSHDLMLQQLAADQGRWRTEKSEVAGHGLRCSGSLLLLEAWRVEARHQV